MTSDTVRNTPFIITDRHDFLGTGLDVQLKESALDKLVSAFRLFKSWKREKYALLKTLDRNYTVPVYLLDVSTYYFSYDYLLFVATGRSPLDTRILTEQQSVKELEKILWTFRVLSAPISFKSFSTILSAFPRLFVRPEVQARFITHLFSFYTVFFFEHFCEFLSVLRLTSHTLHGIASEEALLADIKVYTQKRDAFLKESGISAVRSSAPSCLLRVFDLICFCCCDECHTFYTQLKARYGVSAPLERFLKVSGVKKNMHL